MLSSSVLKSLFKKIFFATGIEIQMLKERDHDEYSEKIVKIIKDLEQRALQLIKGLCVTIIHFCSSSPTLSLDMTRVKILFTCIFIMIYKLLFPCVNFLFFFFFFFLNFCFFLGFGLMGATLPVRV